MDEDQRGCPVCGSTETDEMVEGDQSITVCAECGDDSP